MMNLLKLTQNGSIVANLIIGFSLIVLLLVFSSAQSLISNFSSLSSVEDLNLINQEVVAESENIKNEIFELVTEVKRISEQGSQDSLNKLKASLETKRQMVVSSINKIQNFSQSNDLEDVIDPNRIIQLQQQINALVDQSIQTADFEASSLLAEQQLVKLTEATLSIEGELGLFFDDLLWSIDDDQSLITLYEFYASFLKGINAVKNISSASNELRLTENQGLYAEWKMLHDELFLMVISIISRYPEFKDAAKKIGELGKQIHGIAALDENSLSTVVASSIAAKQNVRDNIQAIESAIFTLTTEIGELSDKAADYNEQLSAELKSKLNTAQLLLVVATIVSIALAAGIASVLILAIKKPLNRILDSLSYLDKGDLSRSLAIESRNEFGEIATSIESVRKNLNQLIAGLVDESSQIHELVNASNRNTLHTNEQVQQQTEDIDNVVEAMSHMIETVSEVATEAEATKDFSQSLSTLSQQGSKSMQASSTAMNELNDHLANTAETVQEMTGAVENIEKILSVIGAIAEQTNLLALNAAIEAARAGEQGRGFAVVADEVRGLASRTQQSTSEIQEYIVNLTERSNKAVQAIVLGQEYSASTKSSVEALANVVASLNERTAQLNETGARISNIASSQDIAATKVNQDIQSVSESSNVVISAMRDVKQGAENLSVISNRLRDTTASFTL